MAQDFLTGLLEGITPPVQEAIKTRVKQRQTDAESQKKFARTINEIFLRGEQTRETAKAKEKLPSQVALTKQRERGRTPSLTSVGKALEVFGEKPTGAVKEGTRKSFLGIPFGGQRQFAPEQQLLRQPALEILQASQQGGIPEFDTPQAAKDAGLPIGSVVIINGELVEIDE